MAFSRKIVLHCPNGYMHALDALVEAFLSDGVVYIGVVGHDCSRVEDIIDELVVGDGSDQSRFILTSSHEGETLEDAIQFAHAMTGEYAGDVEVIVL